MTQKLVKETLIRLCALGILVLMLDFNKAKEYETINDYMWTVFNFRKQ